MVPKNFIDLTGMKYGRLTVIKRAENSKQGKVKWLCVCDCGNEKSITSNDLRMNKTISCGCYLSEVTQKKNVTHGLSKTRQFKIWQGIKDRCSNPKNPKYHHYGGKGILLCSEWNSFEKFWEDMQEGYDKNLSIDRIDNNNGYCKENCRWANQTTQMNNYSRNRTISYNNETHNIVEWSKILGIHFNTLRKRLNNGWSIDEAFTRLPWLGNKKIRQREGLL